MNNAIEIATMTNNWISNLDNEMLSKQTIKPWKGKYAEGSFTQVWSPLGASVIVYPDSGNWHFCTYFHYRMFAKELAPMNVAWIHIHPVLKFEYLIEIEKMDDALSYALQYSWLENFFRNLSTFKAHTVRERYEHIIHMLQSHRLRVSALKIMDEL